MRMIDSDEYKKKLYAMMPEFDEENDKKCIEGHLRPILFNTDMVRAILADRKTVTRRVVKPQPDERITAGGNTLELLVAACVPYRPGDILYVRETWTQDGDVYRYKAGFYDQNRKWRPFIHMPREAARIFLRVTDVRVERLQEITEEQAILEGFEAYHSDSGYYEPATLGFVETWDSTIKKTDHALYGWDANPWVWVIEFEHITREEAIPNA